MTIYDLPGTNGAWERRKQFGFPWSELAERVYITSNYQDFKNITQNYVIEKESIFTSKLTSSVKGKGPQLINCQLNQQCQQCQ